MGITKGSNTDALVHVEILRGGGVLNDTTSAVINLNYMTRCQPIDQENFLVYFTDGHSVHICGNYAEFITLVRSICYIHPFEKS